MISIYALKSFERNSTLKFNFIPLSWSLDFATGIVSSMIALLITVHVQIAVYDTEYKVLVIIEFSVPTFSSENMWY